MKMYISYLEYLVYMLSDPTFVRITSLSNKCLIYLKIGVYTLFYGV